MEPNEQAALWGELQARLPRLRCACERDSQLVCDVCLTIGVAYAHQEGGCDNCCGCPDVARLRRAAGMEDASNAR